MSEIKLCKNCKHEKCDALSYLPLIGHNFRTYSKCAHPEYSEIDLITGKNQLMSYCFIMILFDGRNRLTKTKF